MVIRRHLLLSFINAYLLLAGSYLKFSSGITDTDLVKEQNIVDQVQVPHRIVNREFRLDWTSIYNLY